MGEGGGERLKKRENTGGEKNIPCVCVCVCVCAWGGRVCVSMCSE